MLRQSNNQTKRGPGAPSAVPSYLDVEQEPRAPSTSSLSSIRTQVPLSYYVQDSNSHEDLISSSQMMAQASSYNSGNQITFNMPLNPNAPAYVPGYLDIPNMMQGRQNDSRSGHGEYDQGASRPPFSQQSQGYGPGNLQQHAYGHGYGQGDHQPQLYHQNQSQNNQQSQLHHRRQSVQQGQNNQQGRMYSHGRGNEQYGTMQQSHYHGANVGGGAFPLHDQPYAPNLNHPRSNYGPNAGISDNSSFETLSTMDSSSDSYNTFHDATYHRNSSANYASRGYTQQQSQGHNRHSSFAQHQNAKCPATKYDNTANLVNTHRYNQGQGFSNPSQSTYSGPWSGDSYNTNSQNFSGLTSATDRNNGEQYNRSSSAPLRGDFEGPTRPGSTTSHRTSPERGSQSISSNTDDHLGAPTPGPRPYRLDVEFSSEPRNQEPSTIRASRGQLINTSTDLAKKNSMSAWLENTPGGSALVNRQQRDLADRARSPTRHPRTFSGNMDVLASINEAVANNEGAFRTPAKTRGHGYTTSFVPPNLALLTPRGPLIRGPGNQMSNKLRELTNNGTQNPTVEEALNVANLPFTEYCREAKPDGWGVIRIKNIPYSINRPEIMAFLGRNARVISENQYEPVHIIMERVTSKTLDCYIEFVSFEEAVIAVNKFDLNKTGGRTGRLGQRHVEIELSCQDQLMQALFPKAKDVKWVSGRPHIKPRDPNDRYNSGFQGFVSKEELVMLVKHVETPQRDCPQRPFECLISTLAKYPWYMVNHITIQDRNLLHKATKDLLSLLVERVANDRENVSLTPMLLKRAWRAAMTCTGFTPSMKDDIVVICNINIDRAMELGLAPHASHWRYLWTIGPKPGVPLDVLLWYISLIRDYTTQRKQTLSLAEQAAQGIQPTEPKLFGELDSIIEYPNNLGMQTLAQVALAEWTGIERVLRRALTPALEDHRRR